MGEIEEIIAILSTIFLVTARLFFLEDVVQDLNGSIRVLREVNNVDARLNMITLQLGDYLSMALEVPRDCIT